MQINRLALVLPVLSLPSAALAEPARIIAIGASNTYAYAVPTSQAWPALLESSLRAKGYDVTVTVVGVDRGNSATILSRVDSAIPPGTKVVVFDLGAGRDRDRGATDTAANKAAIMQAIRAHGAVPIFAAYGQIVGAEDKNPSAWIAGDPNHHLTVQSQAKVAAALVPQVSAALKKR